MVSLVGLTTTISALPLLKFNSPSSTGFSPLRRHSPSSTQIRMSSATSTATTTTIEHIVLFNVKENTDPTKLSSMLTGLNSLRSIDVVQHISVGPVHRTRSTGLNFTHMLHSRYSSKDDLATYSAHPAHVDVVRSSVLPICDDLMVVDWVAQEDLQPGSSPKPGSGMRVQFVKLKEGLGEIEKGEVLEVIGGLKEKVKSIEEITCGENFSPAVGKGFSIASIGVFKGIDELNALDEDLDIEKEKEKIRDYIDGLVIVDYVVPSEFE